VAVTFNSTANQTVRAAAADRHLVLLERFAAGCR
jgi:hypothetical protein